MTLGAGDLVLCAGTLPLETSWTERLAAASRAGFAGMSVWGRDYAAARRDGWRDADLRAQLADHGLSVAELDPAWWWTPGEFDVASLVAIDAMQVFRYGETEMFAIADALGARSINAADVLGGKWGVDDAAEAFAGLCERAAEHGLLVHLEFLPWSRIADLATAWEIVRRADRPNGGVAVDAWHWFRSDAPSDVTTLRTIPGAKVLAIQLDDAPAAREPNLMSATLHQRLLPGDGAIDLAVLIGALRDIDTDAPIGVEVFSDTLHALGPIEAAQRAADATRGPLGSPVTRPFRFAVITSKARDAHEWRERAQRAEALGYSTLLMPDHFQDQLAPFTALATAAAVTERLAVGTLVFDNDYRHPVVLAKELATLDLLTGGRVEVGMGAGWKRSDYDETGIAYDPPGARIDRMVEAIQVMRALWTSTEPVHFAGAHYRIAGAVGTPAPHTAGGPTVCIGGGGRRMLTIAARVADIVAVNATMRSGRLDASIGATASPHAFDEKLGWVREAAAASGRSHNIELQCHCAFVRVTTRAADRDSTLAAMAPAFGCDTVDAPDIPLTLIGSIDDLVDTILRRRDRWGFTYTVVPDDAMEAFAPVVTQLAGRT